MIRDDRFSEVVIEETGQGIPGGPYPFRSFIRCVCGEYYYLTIMDGNGEREFQAQIFLDKHLDCRLKK